MYKKPSNTKFYSQVVDLLKSARGQVVRTVNQTMVLTYFEVGRMIVEEEQNGKERAGYGKQLLIRLSERMRSFYQVYGKSTTVSSISEKVISTTVLSKSENEKHETPSSIFNLSWSHYLKLMQIDNENERRFYEIESAKKTN